MRHKGQNIIMQKVCKGRRRLRTWLCPALPHDNHFFFFFPFRFCVVVVVVVVVVVFIPDVATYVHVAMQGVLDPDLLPRTPEL
jgi:hypothetical protein